MLFLFGRSWLLLGCAISACYFALRSWQTVCNGDAPETQLSRLPGGGMLLSEDSKLAATDSTLDELLKILELGDVELGGQASHHKRALTVVASEGTPSFYIVLRNPQQDKSVSREVAQKGMVSFPKLQGAIRERAPTKPFGALMVDVGANLGYFGLLARSLNYNTTFVDIQCGNIARIKLAARLNGWHDGVQLFRNAAGFHSGQVRSIVKGDVANPGGWGVGARVKGTAAVDDCSSMTVLQLDTSFPRETIDVMKIDVEAFENEVLGGMARMLKEHRVRVLVIEYWFVTGPEHLHKFLQWGYQIEVCKDSTPLTAEAIPAFIDRISCEKHQDGRPCMDDLRVWLPE